METLADLEYIVNESMIDDEITFTECSALRGIIDELKRSSNHAKTGTEGKKAIKKLNKELAEKHKLEEKIKQAKKLEDSVNRKRASAVKQNTKPMSALRELMLEKRLKYGYIGGNYIGK